MKQNSTKGRQGARCKAWLLSGILIFTVAQARGEVPAARPWPAEPKVSLTAAGNTCWQPGSGAYYGSLAGSIALEFASPTRRRKAGLFANYRVTSGDAERDSLQAGGWASADFSRWQATFGSAYFDPHPGAGHWVYAGNLRFRLHRDHWLGLEATGRAGGGRPDARLAYEGRVGGFLWLRFSVGLGADGQSEALARSEVVWRIR